MTLRDRFKTRLRQIGHRSLDAWLGVFDERMAKGASEYDNESFGLGGLALVQELMEEVADIAGWGFVLYTRLEYIRELLAAVPGSGPMETCMVGSGGTVRLPEAARRAIGSGHVMVLTVGDRVMLIRDKAA